MKQFQLQLSKDDLEAIRDAVHWKRHDMQVNPDEYDNDYFEEEYEHLLDLDIRLEGLIYGK